MKIQKTMLAAAIALASLAAQATTTIGGYSFADNAFADNLLASNGTAFIIEGTAPTVAANITDNDPYTGVFNTKDLTSSLTLQFTDNVAYNGAGADLVLFDIGSVDRFYLTINGKTVGNTTDITDYTSGYKTVMVSPAVTDSNGVVVTKQLNAVAIDLSDFGVAQGQSINTVTVGMNLGTIAPIQGNSQNESRPTLGLVGALYTAAAPVPEPETYAMLLAGLGAIGAMVRRRKKA